MVLSDTDISRRIGYGDLKIEPYDETNLEPASIDLRLGGDFKRPKRQYAYRSIDPQEPSWHPLEYEELEYDDFVTLHPGDFILATTKETVTLPDDIAAKVLGRSSLGRLGVSVHQTAGYIDPGFEGQITLELSNHGPASVKLRPDMRFGQIVFHELTSPANEPYGHDGSNYQKQSGATPSSMDFE